MQPSRLSNLPDPLPQVLTSLPVFYLLEYLGRNPSRWETAWGFAHRVGITEAEASEALEALVARGILEGIRTSTGDRVYRLTTQDTPRELIIGLADRINRSRDEFLAFVREILRRQVENRHA